ncbi:MAG TPA: DNA mismatch repair protein MutS [Candidatus Polarisedimenticolaceae bacterium]|nr:DNA mismatch repair protein MutS [Candidatus Polarisedimenticolaceae bacterium]
MSVSSTPMFEQYHRIKRDHRDAILMFRMGDFYEMFFDDARTASEVLDIALTARGKGTGNEAPMCGVPHHAVDAYIARLIASGHKVAVCDQMEDAGLAKGLVKREVVRVVSPGTLTDPASLDARENLFIACLLPADGGVGAACIDLSTGEFRLLEARGAGSWDRMSLQLTAFRPREILQPEGADAATLLDRELTTGVVVSNLEPFCFGTDAAYRALAEQMGTASLEGFGCQEMDLAVRAGGALLEHLKRTQRSSLQHIRRVLPYRPSEHMIMDPPTQRTLEVTRSLAHGGRAGSLLSVLDRTVTAMGARRLAAWLLAPPLDVGRIEARLDAVEELTTRGKQRDEIRASMKGIRDIERLLGRVILGAADARDLVSLRDSLAPLPRLSGQIAQLAAPLLTGSPGPLVCPDTSGPPGALDTLEDLHDLLARSIDDDPPATLHEGKLIRAGYSAEVDSLRGISHDGASTIAAMESRERERSGISSLRIRYNRVFGYYIEVSKSNLPLVPSDYERKQTLVGAERFITPELKQYEQTVLTAQERLERLEFDLFVDVREQVAQRAERLKAAAERIADLDTLAALAEVAAARGYTRPVIADDGRTRIVEGRHPVVEALATQTRFVPNDVTLAPGDARVLIVTGPNMGGKSTYLRQTAIITLMAQMGSFVPATSAEIGLTDRIFSRIGASDNLAGGQSTFMVEMQETANILNNATDRSLILLDEVGRGTSTFDGLSLAWAIVEHLHDAPAREGFGARVLFATHYHELTEIALTMAGVRNLTVAVKESGQDVIFLRRIVEGAADRSYGIQVARLAGLPQRVIERAREVLSNLESNELGRDGLPKMARHAGPAGTARTAGQLPLFAPPLDPVAAEVLDRIRGLDPDATTPMDALRLLASLKARLDPSD